MTRVILSGAEEIAYEAADSIVKLAQEVLNQKEYFRLVLSGGSTPKRLFKILTGDSYQNQLPWDRVHFFWGDERSVAPDHSDSNYRMAREAFLNHLKIPESHIHRLKGEASDLNASALEYEGEIRDHFSIKENGVPPHFDLILLGMGSDGHTASLFPNTSALEKTNRWIVANYVEKFRTTRLTMTPLIINQAAWVIFLISGSDKASILSEVLEGPYEPKRLPSQLIQPEAGNIIWLLDRAAAERLKQQ